MKGQNSKKYKWRELNLMCKADEKTRQYYCFTVPQNALQKLRKLALRKHELIIDFGGQKRNQIQQYFILVL